LVLEETKWNAQRPLRLLQHGPVLVVKGAAGAARSNVLLQRGSALVDTASNMLAV
jgi:hypothetical protein